MAIPGFGLASKTQFPARLPSIYCIRRVGKRSVTPLEISTEPTTDNTHAAIVASNAKVNGAGEGPKWKILSSKDLGISNKSISKPTRVVLNRLKENRFQVYLVGGSVRDLILKQTPKDFDVVTSAELREVMRIFPQCRKVGRRFPICHVLVDGTIIEVSSFSTNARKSDQSKFCTRPPDCDMDNFLRWRNCMARDFTINGLMFDPYKKLIYDYLGGMEDIRRAKVQTVIPADSSFQEDCARILRGVRIAARLGFRFSKETALAIKDRSHLIFGLDKGRLSMEMNYMLAYGSAEASLRLLWKIGLLEILLPFQAAYFLSQRFKRMDKRSNMLLSLFSSLDALLAPDRPCHESLWVAILAFHKSIVDHPRDPLVLAVFALAIYNGGNLSEAVKIGRSISQPHDHSFPELSGRELDSDDALVAEVRGLATTVQTASSTMADGFFVSQAMSKYPQAPHSDLVFISYQMHQSVCQIFDCIKKGKERSSRWKPSIKIDYECLALGNIKEVRQEKLTPNAITRTLLAMVLVNSSNVMGHKMLSRNCGFLRGDNHGPYFIAWKKNETRSDM